MLLSLYALLIGFFLDLLFGEPRMIPHPVVLIGKLISFLNKNLRRIFPKTVLGERLAGGVLWLIVVTISTGVPFLFLCLCHWISPWLRLAVESVMCWHILATKSLRTESMKVYAALCGGDRELARHEVSMIVGRDTERLTEGDIVRATVETIAENTSDGVIAPLLFLAIGGAPLGFFYKAVNTMDSMLGYVEPPYRNIGYFPAKLDDVMNFIPSRISAILMLIVGFFLRLDVRNGWKIFLRDRRKHSSPNAAQTESVFAGLLGLRLAGDAWYHGVLHKKDYIGDPLREIEYADIPRSCRVLYATAVFALLLCTAIKLLILL